MTLDATKPDSTTFLSEFSGYARETREAVNALEVESGATRTELNVNVSTLAIGTELSVVTIEIITMEGNSALATITGGTTGMVKIFNCQSGTMSFVHDESGEIGGVLRLNAFEDLTTNIGDVIAFINVGGDGASNDGYWQELYRTLKATD